MHNSFRVSNAHKFYFPGHVEISVPSIVEGGGERFITKRKTKEKGRIRFDHHTRNLLFAHSMLFAGQASTQSERKKGKMAVSTEPDPEDDPDGELFPQLLLPESRLTVHFSFGRSTHKRAGDSRH